MNTCLLASVENSWLLAGWTMIHFLWLGTLVALAGLLSRWLLRRASANVRYAVALTCLALLAALPIAIATWLHAYSPSVEAANRSLQNGAISQIARTEQGGATELKNIESTPLAIPSAIENSATPISAQSAPRTVQPIDLTVARPLPVTSAPAATDPLSLAMIAINSLVRYLPWLWLIGTPLTFILTATGLLGGRRLRRASRPITDGPIAEALEKLAASLRLGRRVAVAICDRIAAPVLIGILRPIILLPPAALTGYSPDEIEMVLLHELAHVRRWDNLVNLIQRLVESLLFFHPAVWLISSWVRRERESCCDALVVTRTDRPHAYAELLVALAAQMPRSVLFHPAASSAMAAGPLRSRIRRILQLDDDPMLISGKSFTLVLGTLLVAATLAVLYVPSIGQAEQPTTEATDGAKANSNAAAEAQTKNNLKNLSLALQNYHETRKLLPAHAIYDAKGLPLLSWRVQILPFLDEPKLYQEFHLNEPWDSEHNRKLIARMPAVFKNPKLNKPGLTNYLAVVGEECIFNGSPKALGFKHVTDGTSNTIALVEANADLAVEWTKPEDWNFNRALPTEGLGQLWPGGWYAALVDGSVRRIANSEPADRVGIQFTRAGGETHSLQESADRLLAGGAAVAERAVGLEGGPSAESPPEARPKSSVGDANAKADQPSSWDTKPLLSPFGIDPTKEPSGDEAKDLAELFRSAGVVNAIENRTYDVPVGAQKMLQMALDSIKHGPLHKHVPFEYKWDDSHSHITITAARLALNHFFDPMIPALRLPLANETVLLTLPDNWDNSETNPQLRAAIDYADQKNLRIEMSSRNGKPVLVGTPLPSESEWPAVLGDPPQKDRVIAEKAWQRLGLKLLPMTDLHPGLRVVGGNLPKGLPRYAFLEFVEGTPIATFDDLLSWLESESGRSDKSVKCYANSNQKEYLFYAKPASAEGGDNNRASSDPVFNRAGKTVEVASRDGVANRAKAPNTKFPSLEEQKLADLAWKRLQLELEPLNEKDLKRIQALGYEGGLKIVGGSGAMMERDKQVLWEDILVGLHVWPVTNFANLAEVLNRNDIAELTPLKYYVVRHFDRENPPRDAVVTGRIGITLQEERSGRSFRSRPSSSPSSSNPQTSKTSTPTFASGDTAAAAASNVASQLDAASKSKQEITSKFSEPPNKIDAEQESVLRDVERSRQRRRDEFQSAAESTRRELEKIKPLDKNQNHFKSSYEPSNTPASPAAVSNAAAPTNAATGSPSTPAANAKPATAALPGTVFIPNGEKLKVAINIDPSAVKQEAVFVAYDIPPEFIYQAQQYFRTTNVPNMSDGNGRRNIVQASPAWHEHFAALLKATPKWRDPAAAKERASAAIVMKKVDGEDILEFRCLGLTFKPLTEPRNFGSPREPVALAAAAVGEVAPGSPAAWADVRPGDVLTDIGSFKAGTLPEVHSLIKALGEGLQPRQQVRFMFVREAPHRRSTVVADLTLSPEDVGAKPAEPQTAKASANKAAVIYEGKSFTTWQSAWQSELSTEKRLEAVKAIATFGANGFGPEAAGSILDVAGQYDWVAVVRLDQNTTFEPEGKLQRAIFGVLIGAPGAVKIEPKYWLPLLRKRYEVDPDKWQNAAILLLSELSRTTETQNDDIRAMLLILAQSTNEHIASQAYDALVRRYPDNEELTKRLTKMYQDKTHWISAVRWLGWTPQYPPEVVDLLLHGNRKQQADARNTFRDIPPTPAKKALVATMIAILKDDSKTVDHIAAIRALGALGPDGSFGQHEALQLLEEIVKKAPLEKKAAAAFALQYAARDKFHAIVLLEQYGGEPEGVGLNPAEAQATFNKESEAFNGK